GLPALVDQGRISRVAQGQPSGWFFAALPVPQEVCDLVKAPVDARLPGQAVGDEVEVGAHLRIDGLARLARQLTLVKGLDRLLEAERNEDADDDRADLGKELAPA